MRFIRFLTRTLASLFVTLALIDLGIRVAFPSLPRFQDNFSAAYLSRALDGRHLDGRVVFLGDSVLWGYRLPASDAAPEILTQHGVAVANLSFEGGSIANTYAMLRLMQERGIRPGAVVFNVNVKEFNAADSAYRTLYPALETLAWPELTQRERNLLTRTAGDTTDARIDRALSRTWALYGLRSDIREQLFTQTDAATAAASWIGQASGRNARTAAAHQPTAERFLGTYDLAPLSEQNVQLIFLRQTAALLGAMHVRAVAIITPANHRLLHDYIDVPEYDDQLRLLGAVAARGARVLNYDRAFQPNEFIDNDHLTAQGNRHLAALLLPVLQR